MVKGHFWLNDKQWAKLGPLLPPYIKGKRRVDDRRVLSGIIQVLQSGCRWSDKRTKNHINGIEGFWSFAKHILYNYRGFSKYHFPIYLKEIEFRFNHRRQNLFKLFLQTFFGYVLP